MKKYTYHIIIALGIILICGCTSTRINHFQQFAEAGKAYSDAIAVLTDEAGKAAINADSLILMKTREHLTKKKRTDTVLEHNRLLKERLSLLADLRRHALLLKSYFVALSALASSDSPSGIGEAAKGVVNSLGELSDRIKNAKVGNLAVNDFTGSITSIIVANFQRSALENELELRAKIIEKELDLQQAAFSAISKQLKTDLEAVILDNEKREIVAKYRDNKPLPKDWAKKRQEILSSSISLASADAAADAAKSLKLAFVSLIENKFTITDIDSLIKDINEILTLIEKIEEQEESDNNSN